MEALKTGLALAAVNVFFGLGYPLVKTIIEQIDPARWLFFRIAGTSALLLLFFYKRIFSTLRKGKTLFWLLIASLFGIIINQICFVEGLDRSIPAHSAIINTTIPLQTLLFARFLIGERITPLKILGILSGFAGIAILLRFDKGFANNPFLIGDLLTTLNAVSYSLFLVIVRKKLSHVDPMTSVTWVSLFGVIGIGFYARWDLPLNALINLTPLLWFFVIYVITFQSIFTYAFNFWALRRTHASHVAMYVYLQPLVATLLGYFLLGDVPDNRFYLSAGLILAGLVLGGI